ncbi:MAG: cytochrome b N-terminal domain-containing protein [Nitrospinota bacterium]
MINSLIDWFDLRLGIKSFYKNQIAYVLPESISFWTFFGGLTIFCILIQIVTGIYMVTYYVPVPELAHESIKAMANTTTIGRLFRNVHRWSATLGMIFLLIHAFHIMARRAYRSPRELNWFGGLILAFLFILLLITGIIVPWDWRSYWELVIWTDWIGSIPLIGSSLKEPILANFTLGRNYALHIILLPALLLGFLFIHIIVMRRIGLSERVQ